MERTQLGTYTCNIRVAELKRHLLFIGVKLAEVAGIPHAAAAGLAGGEGVGGRGVGQPLDGFAHGGESPAHAPTGPRPPGMPRGPAGLLIRLLQAVYSELLKPVITLIITALLPQAALVADCA